MGEKGSETVLSSCGVSEKTINSFKERGFIVPEKIEPVEEPLRSPSEEWFYLIADRFTPPLSKTEREVYKDFPHAFCRKIVEAIDFLSEIGNTLINTLEEAKKERGRGQFGDKEAVAAVFSILKIFHGSLDNNYLKYDRHLEYHEHERSPVGYHWQRFKNLCREAAENTGAENIDRWVTEKVQSLMSGPRRNIITSEYAVCCNNLFKKLKPEYDDLEDLPPEDLIDNLRNNRPDLLKAVNLYSDIFYREPVDILWDSITSGGTNPQADIEKSKKKTLKTIDEIKSNLPEEKKSEFEIELEVIEDFLATQEIEGFKAHGNNVLMILSEAFDFLQEIILHNLDLVKPEARETVKSLFGEEKTNPPEKWIALRELMTKEGEVFNERVKELYSRELKRWK